MSQLDEGQGGSRAATTRDHPSLGRRLPCFPNTLRDWGSQGLSQGREREGLAVGPALGTKGGIHDSEPQSQAASMISLPGNRFFYQQKDFFGNIFFINGGITEMSGDRLGVRET